MLQTTRPVGAGKSVSHGKSRALASAQPGFGALQKMAIDSAVVQKQLQLNALAGSAQTSSAVIQRKYEVELPTIGQTVDIDDARWSMETLNQFLQSLPPEEQLKHAPAFKMAMQRAGEREQLNEGPDMYKAPKLSGNRGPDSTRDMSDGEKAIYSKLILAEEVGRASAYSYDPREISASVESGETRALLPDTPALASHKVASVGGSVEGMAGSFALNQGAKYGSEALGHALGPVASAVGGTVNAGHTGVQAGRLAAISSGDAETSDAVSHLAKGRGKKSATQVGSTAGSVSTGAVVGGAIGTAIPVPVLGTLIGIGVGSAVGFIVKKVVERAADSALQDPEADYQAALALHRQVLEGNEDALEVFTVLGIPENVAKAKDGWKALTSKLGAKSMR